VDRRLGDEPQMRDFLEPTRRDGEAVLDEAVMLAWLRAACESVRDDEVQAWMEKLLETQPKGRP
jgi:hypothetical protein